MEDDDEITIVTGGASESFAHSRSDCPVYPFQLTAHSNHCANCYCFVCDIPAKGCQQWTRHKDAYNGSSVNAQPCLRSVASGQLHLPH